MKKLLLLPIFLLLFTKQSFASNLNPQTELETQTMTTVNNSVVGERVEDFSANIHVNKDGSLAVVETIRYFFDTPKHGIFRYIPFTKYDKEKRYDIDFKFEPVVDEKGREYEVTRTKQGEQWVLKVGDPNTTISGEHTYVISYTAKGELGYFDDHDELYWNVTGNGWEIPIKKARVTITLPEKLTDTQITLDCFTGGYGTTKKNCTGATDGLTTTIETTLFLNSNEGLTVVEGFPKGIVAVLKPTEYVPFFDRWYGKIVLGLLIFLSICWYIILPIWLIIHWYRNGRDPFVGIPLTAGYDAPKAGKRSLTPAETGTLIDETVQTRDIFSSIVDLARRGYLRINEPEKKDFYLEQVSASKANDTLQPFEKKLLDGIFEEGKLVRLKDTKLYQTIADVKKLLYQDMVDAEYFKTNPNTTRTKYYALGGIALFTGNFVLAFISFLFGKNMPKKTISGAQQAQVAKSLKNFLTSQERQIEFQADKQMFFEKLLPFAVAFGVEKIWAKRFEQFDLKQPDWYRGYNSGTFNAAIFASSLSHSYNSFSVSSTPPSSSSSSGFGGGGFSGGGGGGGGGGSW